MKIKFKQSLLLIFLSVSFWTNLVYAEPTARDELIHKVKSVYFQGLIAEDSQYGNAIFKAIKAANPNTSEDTLMLVKKEIFAIASKDLGGESAIDALFLKVFGKMPNDELERLVVIIADPAFKKFQALMADPDIESELMQESAKNMLMLQSHINRVLKNHGLNEFH